MPGRWAAWAVLLLSLVGTLAFWNASSLDVQHRLGERFESRIQQIQTSIESRLRAYEQVLLGGSGLFKASSTVSRSEWKRYVEVLNIEDNYPGIQGIGYTIRVPPEDKARHETQVRQEGFPDYQIWPDVGQRPYTSIVYLEPFDWRNQRAFGFDMSVEESRRDAMERARDTGRAAMSGKVVLVQETAADRQNGFLMYVPVYGVGAEPASVAERRERLMGYVYSPFRMRDFLHGTLGDRPDGVNLMVYDGAMSDEAGMLYHPDEWPAPYEGLEAVRTLTLYGRPWTIRYAATPQLASHLDTSRPQFILAAGGMMSLLLFAVVWVLASTNERAFGMAQEMTRDIRERKAQLREITSTLGEGLYVVDRQGRITFVNPAAQRILGRSEQELVGRDAHELLHGDGEGGFVCGGRCQLAIATEQERPYQTDDETFRTRDGVVPVEVISAPISRGGRVAGAVVAFHDITRRRAAENALRETERFRALFEYASDALFLVDDQGRIVDTNKVAPELTGYERDELVGAWASDLLTEDGSAAPLVFTDLPQRLQPAGKMLVPLQLRTKDERRVAVEASVSALEQESRALALLSVRDVTARQKAEAELKQALSDLEKAKRQSDEANKQLARANESLRYLTKHDALTGVANRRYFQQTLVREWRRAVRGDDGQWLAVILVDIDDFKKYNDTYGHPAGDECLRQVAAALRGSLSRSSDFVARYGGEEFVLVLADTDPDGAMRMGERLRQAVASLEIPHVTASAAPFVTLSVGVACAAAVADAAPGELLGLADQALYAAKAEGRNRVVLNTAPWSAAASTPGPEQRSVKRTI